MVLICALLVTSVANAGLIATKVTDNHWSTNEPFATMDYYSIVNLGAVEKESYGEMRWEIDLTDRPLLSFSVALSLSNSLFSSFSVLLMDSQSTLSLRYYTTNVGNVAGSNSIDWYQEEIELSHYYLSQFTDINEVNLVFRHTAIEDSPSSSLISHSSQSSIAQALYKDISFAREAKGSTPVPEPTSMVLFLIALAYMGRKQFSLVLTKTTHKSYIN